MRFVFGGAGAASSTASPPARVPIARQARPLMPSLTKRTEPSAIAALTPRGCRLRADAHAPAAWPKLLFTAPRLTHQGRYEVSPAAAGQGPKTRSGASLLGGCIVENSEPPMAAVWMSPSGPPGRAG